MPKIIRHTLSATLLAGLSIVAMPIQAAEEGIAAYYSNVFHGRKTASGKIYDKNQLTAAHKTLAFGTKVKVTDLGNNKSVVVTITDRGPYTKKRIIDLSYAAAKEIDLLKPGLSQVRLDILE